MHDAMQNTMREVRLYGHLGKRFGRVFRFDVRSPAEAIRALRANLEGFEAYLFQHSAPGFHVFVGKTNVGQKDLLTSSDDATIRIVPVVAGAGHGVFQTILGAVLVVVGAYFDQSWLVNIGVSMMVGGITQMLIRPPGPATPPNNQASYCFNGPVNTTAQGNPVPICYGAMIVGSQVVSAGLSVEQIAV
ncbi:tail assembly protein [Undibacterium sp. Rencai35W]|uniref:tail assembly protein n=1 Tax=Undibacterium sp. Rencai35W TaxID=3413046 RepID=UPI003BEF9ACA